ncbi:MAG TPA: serine hydrolase [Thermoanaerobaculia bacterium]|nr:serine hydrolase [Thermoanaerobaculia bacterium]
MLKLASLLALCLAFATNLLAATHAEKIDALLTAYHKQRYFNGSALVAEKGQVILRKGYGLANMEWDVPNAADTKFRLGSITKQFTSMVIMQLVSEGKIKLDEKMTAYLPEYRKDTGDKITIRHLLTHTSGIPSYTGFPGFFQKSSRDPYEVDAFVKEFASRDLEFEPGTKWAYNNSGYFLLGAIIEKVTGKSYADAVKERIFDPLGMKDSGYDSFATVLPKRAAGYALTPNGYVNAPYLDMSIPYAAGSLYSTVEDLYKWDRALYGDKLLSADLKKTMFTPLLQNYAFGWAVAPLKLDDQKTEVATIRHNGGIHGFNTLEIRIPETQDLVVLLDNTSRGDKLDGAARGIIDILRDVEAPMPKASLVDEVIKTSSGALARVRELKTKSPDAYDFSEPEVNRLGYTLMARSRVAEAVDVFRLNVDENPKSWNAYDSLAEAYEAHGDRDLAIANFKKSLELNPKNDNGAAALKRLEAPPQPKPDAATLDKYVGTYEIGPGFNITFTREGDRLFSQATGQPKFEVVADSPTEFHPLAFRARIVFAADGSSLTLYQGDREIVAKRIAGK